MDFAPQRNGCGAVFSSWRICRYDADLGASSRNGLRACQMMSTVKSSPQCLFARVGVDQARQRGDVQPEIVEERRILPEVVGVIRVIIATGLPGNRTMPDPILVRSMYCGRAG